MPKMKVWACNGKQQHLTQRAAEDHMWSLFRYQGYSYANPLEVYKCDRCGFWHVGHRPMKYRRKKR